MFVRCSVVGRLRVGNEAGKCFTIVVFVFVSLAFGALQVEKLLSTVNEMKLTWITRKIECQANLSKWMKRSENTATKARYFAKTHTFYHKYDNMTFAGAHLTL